VFASDDVYAGKEEKEEIIEVVEDEKKDVIVLDHEVAIVENEHEEDMAADNDKEKVVEKEVMHNMFYFMLKMRVECVKRKMLQQ